MRKLRALFCVVLCCIIFSTTCGVTFASGILIDDLPIDPWGDLNDVEDYEPPEPSDPVFSDPFESPPVEVTPDNPFFSLDDTDSTRFISWSSGIEVSFTQDDIWYDIPSGNGQFNFQNSSAVLYSFGGFPVGGNVRMTINPCTSIDFVAEVAYPSDSYESFELSGVGSVYFQAIKNLSQTAFFYPDTIQLLVNGTPYGEVVSISESDGSFTFPVLFYSIKEDVNTLGYRITFNSYHENIAVRADIGASIDLKMYLDDEGIFTFTQVPDEPEYSGLLGTIIGWLSNIWDGIKNIGKSILDGLKELFVPSEEDIVEVKEMYNALLEERLGAVYELFTWLSDFAGDVVDAFKSRKEYTFTFPGISFPMNGEMVVILGETEVDMDNEIMSLLRGVLGTIVSLVCVVAFVNTASDMVIAIVSGTSYFDFLKAKKGGGGE